MVLPIQPGNGRLIFRIQANPFAEDFPHSLPMTSIPNSTIEQTDDQGKVIRIRHYDENGNAYKDVDYTDHGRPDTHKVPHTHIIEIGEIIDRKKGAKSYAH